MENCTTSGAVSTNCDFGGMASLSSAGTFRNCTNNINIKGNTIAGSNSNVGGIVGTLSGSAVVVDCENGANGDIACDGVWRFGGIVGYIGSSTFARDTAIVGSFGSIILDGVVVIGCRNLANITGTGGGGTGARNAIVVGGIVGLVLFNIDSSFVSIVFCINGSESVESDQTRVWAAETVAYGYYGGIGGTVFFEGYSNCVMRVFAVNLMDVGRSRQGITMIGGLFGVFYSVPDARSCLVEFFGESVSSGKCYDNASNVIDLDIIRDGITVSCALASGNFTFKKSDVYWQSEYILSYFA